MKVLIENSTAYKIFCREAEAGRLAHAYMLSFEDSACLREALKIFALRFFGTSAEEKLGGQILREVFPDCRIYPEPGKKFNAEAASALIEDSAMRPAYGSKKLYIISSFEECSAVVQNKLLKVIEEPPEGVSFILGAASLAPVLTTILSRVRLLEISPFTPEQIFGALERSMPGGRYNRLAAESCGGVLSVASALAGGQFADVRTEAMSILSATDAGAAGTVAAAVGDSKYKKQVLAECSRLCLAAARAKTLGGGEEDERKIASLWQEATLVRGSEIFCRALRDLKFNAYYPALINSAMLNLIEENKRWQRLSE